MTAIAAHERGIEYELVFADTLIEDQDLYRFMIEVWVKLGYPRFHWLADGRNPWQVFEDIGMVGNSRIAPCSRILKTEKIKAWFAENARPDDVLVLGMDWSEMDRIERAQFNWQPRQVLSLLNQWKVPRPTFGAILARYGITEPRLYPAGFPHNNCGGFCVRAGQTQFATLLERFPEVYAFHEAWQDAVMARNPKLKPFLRRKVDGVTTYITLRLFRLMIEARAIEVEPFDFGGCGCFTDE